MNTSFDPETHRYTVNGEAWPSVTQLLSEFKLVDFSMVPAERLEYKRVLGTRVHAATVLLDKGELDEDHFNESFPECVPYLNAYRKFREIESFEPVHKEQRYFSKKWKFAGTPDEFGIINGDNYIIDYKCCFQVYPAVSTQLQGYKILLEENIKGIKIKKLLSLLLKKTGHYEITEHKDNQSKNDFLACLVLHWRRRNYYGTVKAV